MKAKPRLQYRLQDTGAARNMKHLLRKLQALNIPKKEAMCAFVRIKRPPQINWSIHDATVYPGYQIRSFRIYVSLLGLT